MSRKSCLFLWLTFSAAVSVFGQASGQSADPASAQAPAATPAPAAPTWSAGGIDFSGLVDGYFDVAFNHPASKVNTIRNFDVKANSFALNFAKLTMEHSTDPVG